MYYYKIAIPQEELKSPNIEKKTIEQAAMNKSLEYKKIYPDVNTYDFRLGFTAGAIHKNEQMYSEEDMRQFAFECVANFMSNDDNKIEMKLVDVIIDRISIKINQYKKK